MRSRRVLALAVPGLALLAVSCSDAPTPAEPEAGLTAARQGTPPGLAGDDELAARIPGYGGFFIDQDGTPTVYLTRGSGRGPAEQALANHLAGRGAASLRVREARYG